MRAPADGSQWRKIERKYWEEFAGDPRNVWFGLSADGINPFVIPRLKRMFRNKEHARLLRWHKEDRKKDGKLRHPTDGSQWRKIERKWPKFADDARTYGLV